MAIAGRTISVAVPHEEGVEFTLRSLSHKVLRNAAKAYLKDVTKDLADLDIGKLRDAIKTGDLDQDVTTEANSQDADYGYDPDMILEAGIVSWSYEQAVNPQTIGELDQTTADWAFRQIVDMSRRKSAERKA